MYLFIMNGYVRASLRYDTNMPNDVTPTESNPIPTVLVQFFSI